MPAASWRIMMILAQGVGKAEGEIQEGKQSMNREKESSCQGKKAQVVYRSTSSPCQPRSRGQDRLGRSRSELTQYLRKDSGRHCTQHDSKACLFRRVDYSASLYENKAAEKMVTCCVPRVATSPERVVETVWIECESQIAGPEYGQACRDISIVAAKRWALTDSQQALLLEENRRVIMPRTPR